MQLAQLNIGIGRHPMDDPRMQGFVGRIDVINALADRSDGFIWRLVDDDEEIDGALDLRLPDSESTLVNMSVWRDIQSLFHFIYKTAHAKVMADRDDYFIPLTERFVVLWWIQDGHIPSLDEAKTKLDAIRANGPTPKAFDFQTPFSADGKPIQINFPKKDSHNEHRT